MDAGSRRQVVRATSAEWELAPRFWPAALRWRTVVGFAR